MTHPFPPVSRTEKWLAGALLLFGLVFRLIYLWHFRIDSDEPQHLHVVWAWSHGQLPYRDVFDNHTPLFQALCAPLFHWLGVRADILLPMRAAMVPLFILTIGCVWRICSALFGARTALWTVVLATFCPPFYLIALEFRPDQLWTLFWLLALTVLLTGPATPRRALGAGLWLGLAFAVSMKTSLMLATLALAMVGALIFRRVAGGEPLDKTRLLRCIGAGLLGMLVAPAIVILFFVLNGAGPDLYYCVIRHNVLPGATHAGRFFRSLLHWIGWLVPIVAGAVVILRLDRTVSERTRIAFAFLAGALFYTTLICFWPILTNEDYLPFFPAMMVTVGPAILGLGTLAERYSRVPSLVVILLVAVGEIAAIFLIQSPFIDETADKIGIIADTLKLTDPTDFVMDSKGETIYRQRPFKFVLEGLTLHRFLAGAITDNIPERLILTRTPLATTRRMPKRAKEFIKENYLPIAFRLRVLGKYLREEHTPPNASDAFEIAVPSRYTIVSPSGQTPGTLDGTPFTGPRELAAGRHEFHPEITKQEVVLIWAAAIERGYSPFREIKEDYTTPQD